MDKFYHTHREALERAAFLALLLVVTVIFFKFLFAYIAPFFVGALIAMIMEWPIKLLVKYGRFKRGTASVIGLLLFLMLMGSLGTLIVSNLSRQVAAFIENAPGYIEEISRKLDDMYEWIYGVSGWEVNNEALASGLTNIFSGDVKDRSMVIVSNVPDFFIGLILALVSAFFFMKEWEPMLKAVLKHSPKWIGDNLRQTRRGLTGAISGYFKAQFILMVIVGIISILGLLIMRNPYALLIGLVIALMDFLPVVGAGTIMLPWAVVLLITGQFSQAVGLTVLFAVVTVARQALQPKILGEQMGLHPLVMLMSFYIGYKVFGLFGIIIGPMLAIVIKVYYSSGVENISL